MKITRHQLIQMIREEARALIKEEQEEFSKSFSPKASLDVDPRYTQSREKVLKRHNRSIYDLSRNEIITNSRVFDQCGYDRSAIVLPSEQRDREIRELWEYIIDERGNRALFAIAIDELLGIGDIGVMGFKHLAKVATKTAAITLRKMVPFIGWAETSFDLKSIRDEWNRGVATGFCEVIRMMDEAYWGETERRHIKLSEWRQHPGYLALIVHYGREQGWSPMKTAQVMVRAGWIHPNEANTLRNEILKADLLKIKFKSQIDALEDSLEIESEPLALIEV